MRASVWAVVVTWNRRALLDRLATIFPNRLYIEVQRHPGEGGRLMAAEAATERGFIEMAYDKGLPLVATNDVYFPKADILNEATN